MNPSGPDVAARERASRHPGTTGRVYIVVLNWNGWQDTVRCLDAATALDFPSITILVCDNGSTDDSLRRIEGWAAERNDFEWAMLKNGDALAGSDAPRKVVLVANGANLGFAAGCNVGARLAMSMADCEFVWFLNNDTVAEPSSLKTMVAMCRADPSIGICGSQVRYMGARDRVQSAGGQLNRWLCTTHLVSREARIDFVPGASMLVPRRYLEKVGLMSEQYFLYFEEIDWAERGKRWFRFAICFDSVIYHVGGASIGNASDQTDRGLRADWYLLRGRLMFARRFYKRFLVTVYLGMFVSILKRFARGDRRRARVALYALANRPVPWLQLER